MHRTRHGLDQITSGGPDLEEIVYSHREYEINGQNDNDTECDEGHGVDDLVLCGKLGLLHGLWKDFHI